MQISLKVDIPPYTIAVIVDLSSCGAHLDIKTFMAGNVTPAPNPLMILITIKYWYPPNAQIGLSNMANTLRNTAIQNTHFPP